MDKWNHLPGIVVHPQSNPSIKLRIDIQLGLKDSFSCCGWFVIFIFALVEVVHFYWLCVFANHLPVQSFLVCDVDDGSSDLINHNQGVVEFISLSWQFQCPRRKSECRSFFHN